MPKVLSIIDLGKLHTGVVLQTICGIEIANANASLAAKEVWVLSVTSESARDLQSGRLHPPSARGWSWNGHVIEKAMRRCSSTWHLLWRVSDKAMQPHLLQPFLDDLRQGMVWSFKPNLADSENKSIYLLHTLSSFSSFLPSNPPQCPYLLNPVVLLPCWAWIQRLSLD